jgi:Leucine-rich repeat (LRR) protein
LTCEFEFNYDNEYTCNLFAIEVTNPTHQVTFAGEHVQGQTNANVRSVKIRASNTPFIIPQIFTTFPNIIELFIHNSKLQSISIPDSIQLQRIDIHRNNISRIVNGTFSGQTQLRSLRVSSSMVEAIEASAFTGAINLTHVDLSFNRLTEIIPPTFQSLSNLVHCDLKDNQLTTIRLRMFGHNPNMETLLLENNRINDTCINFTKVLSRNMVFLNLSNNVCVNRSFQLGDELGMIALNNALNPCFNNFKNEVPEIRRVTLEFRGPIALYDEFGNIIARVN